MTNPNALQWFKRRRGGAAAFVPSDVATVLAWWDASQPATPVASWLDRIASKDLAQATGTKQPAQSATAIAGAYPGVTCDGGDVLVCAPGLGGLSGLTCVFVATDASTAASVMLELTINANSQDGGFTVSPNAGAAGRLAFLVRGTVGATGSYITQDLASPVVVAVGFDYATAGAGAIPWARVNGVDAALTNTLSASAAGTSSTASLYYGGRSATPSVPWTGTTGHLVIRSGVAVDASLNQIERYVGAQAGISW